MVELDDSSCLQENQVYFPLQENSTVTRFYHYRKVSKTALLKLTLLKF